MTDATVRIEIPVNAIDALRDALGFGAHLWDARSIADRLLGNGYVIRKVEELPTEHAAVCAAHQEEA